MEALTDFLSELAPFVTVQRCEVNTVPEGDGYRGHIFFSKIVLADGNYAFLEEVAGGKIQVVLLPKGYATIKQGRVVGVARLRALAELAHRDVVGASP